MLIGIADPKNASRGYANQNVMFFCSYLLHREGFYLVGNDRHIYCIGMEIFIIEDVCDF
jgi:hypothetical protein